ncbi:Uncharacterised protein [Mycoplasmopsis maculosa]|uniref:Uncharacterized protein n=1 Tax=Mycoplasmopsis maculosa TaxID=114885 RepID=A0A449B3N8_9BACT|nr:hypothetical protein [Mycoplasmopsis maculosa]VEU75196.1 Uncharacterised protein [Mycoplasmopsis maculosa]
MENIKYRLKEEIPVLKPLYLMDKFIKKIKGENKLISNIVIVIAQDEEFVYFLNCSTNSEQNIDNENYVYLKVFKEEIKDQLPILMMVDLKKIYKMDIVDFQSKLDQENYNEDDSSELSFKSQVEIVNKMVNKLNEENKFPNMIFIKKNNNFQSTI